jgi:hypothetical protein
MLRTVRPVVVACDWLTSLSLQVFGSRPLFD